MQIRRQRIKVIILLLKRLLQASFYELFDSLYDLPLPLGGDSQSVIEN